jgi:hypothetical protein
MGAADPSAGGIVPARSETASADPAEAPRARADGGHPTSPIASERPLDLADKWLIAMADLSQFTSLSVRHLRRLDSSRDIPGRVVVGRRVLFQTEVIRQWVRAGLPDRDQWAALQTRNGKR